MQLNEIKRVIAEVITEFSESVSEDFEDGITPGKTDAVPLSGNIDDGIFQDMDMAVRAARRAQFRTRRIGIKEETRHHLCDADSYSGQTPPYSPRRRSKKPAWGMPGTRL